MPLVSGDALLFVNHEKQVATSVCRLYLIRYEGKRTILYFDRIVNFITSIPLDKIEFVTLNAPAMLSRRRFFKLELALRSANQREFKYFPEISDQDPTYQTFVRDTLQQTIVADLIGPSAV